MAGAVPQPGSSSAGGGPAPALVLLLARLCVHLESVALPCAVEAVAFAFAGAGGGLGADQPPAFVAAQVSRCASPETQSPGERHVLHSHPKTLNSERKGFQAEVMQRYSTCLLMPYLQMGTYTTTPVLKPPPLISTVVGRGERGDDHLTPL